MSRLFRDSSVLNQFGSPSINSNTLANRPTYGQPGRLFVSTDTLAIYRDTGSAWDNLTANGGTIGTLQQVTTLGNRTNQKIFIGPTSVTPSGSDLDVYGYGLFRNTVNSQLNLGTLLYTQYTINYNGNTLSGFANSIFAQDVYNVSASTNVAASTQAGTSLNINTYKFSAVSTITFTQPGGSIRAASAITAYSQFQNTAAGTITHAAGITILGVENLGGSALTIDNNYQLLINASDEFSNTATFDPLKQWGIYQNGENDRNYFAGNVIVNKSIIPNLAYTSTLGSTSKNFANLYTQNLTNSATPGLAITATFGPITFSTLGNYAELARFEITTGNLLLGTTLNPNAVKLKINGNIEVTTPTATGVHTATPNHLPIYVNNVLYYLQLLN